MRTADLSRGDRVVELGTRVVCVTGGKLTTFRPVAQRKAAAGAERWAEVVGAALGWSGAERERQVRDYREGLDRFRVPA